jgi:hypothetical protein
MAAVALPPQFDEPALRGLRRLDAAVDRGQARVFRVLWFLVPPGSIAWNLQFQALLASRFLADLATQALLFGALIAVARGGGGAVDAALLGVAYLLPGVLLGLYGGAVADALPKRVALAGAYLAMGVLCLLIPTLFGTAFRSLLLVLFVVRALHQVSQPSEAAALPLVATREELASATSFLSFASSAGEVIGKALIAPLVVRWFGVDPVVVLAGLLFMLSSTRALDLRATHAPRGPGVEVRISTRAAVRYLLEARGVLWMLLLAALASTVGVVLGVLGPQYVREVLEVEPANALYVFAPAPLGLLVALALAPPAIRGLGERLVAALGFAAVAAATVGLGLVEPLARRAGWLVPLDVPGIGDEVQLAAQLSVLVGLGTTLAAAASQTYLSRNVPLGIQGRTSALLGTLKDGLAIPTLLALGSVAGVTGVRAVLTAAPLLLLAAALGADRLAGRWRAPAAGAR